MLCDGGEEAVAPLEKGMHVYALAFFTGWLRGLGWKRLLLRSDNERALLAFLRAAQVWKVLR